MVSLRAIAAGLMLAAGAAGPVQSADLGDGPPPEPAPFGVYSAPYGWSGLYAGAQIGAAIGDSDGLIGGATLGYNIQAGQLVWGVETDISASDISGPIALDWLWTLRGRLGIPLGGSIMPYVTGGLAVGDVSADFGGFTETQTNTGWTIGGGLEVALAPNWTLKGEYLYVDLGDVDVPALVTTTIPADDIHIVRAGLNIRF
ncbi:MAG: hypothetical protein RLZ98_2775 [Pseudomonadota bacterium]|jgi:outer membrane immunogenic protein